MQTKITSLFAFILFFLLSGTTQTYAQSVAPCKKYTVASTQNVCGCSDNRWAPYAMAIGTPQSSCTRNLFKPQDLTFQQNGNGTATLSGTLRNNSTWQLVVVNITFMNETSVAPTGSPKLELCNEGKSRSIAESWMYYTKARGTIQVGNDAPLSIQLASTAFQVGKGANGQSVAELGASGVFNLNETTTAYFNFNLTNGLSCSPTDGGGTDNGNGNSNVVSCDSIKFKTNNNAIVISNVNAPNADVQIFDKNWNKLYSCSGSNCQVTRLTNLPAGDYVAKIKMFSNNPWTLICSNDYRLKVTSDSTDVNPPNPCTKDTILPRIICPANITATITNAADTCVRVTWAEPTGTDNCSTPSVSCTAKSNDCFKIGVTTVTHTATDAAGNKASCSFTITVTRAIVNPCSDDKIVPTISCPANITATITNAADTCVRVTWAEPTGTDNCSTPSVSCTAKSNDCFKIGVTTVTHTATDAAGNKASCSFTITVGRAVVNPCSDDKIVPTISCPANITATITNAADTCVKVTWIEPTGSDNCSTPSVSCTAKPNDCFKVGVTTVTHTATDAAGNKASCSFTITVSRAVVNPCNNDKTLPTISCPANISANITNAANDCVNVTWAAPTASDNCSTPSVSSNFKPNDCFKIGVNTVTYTATDSAGNKATCSFTVTVKNTDTCQLYDAKESNLNCGCADPIKRYTPYFLYFGASPTCNVIPSNTFDIRFRKNPDGTGVISGNGRDSAGNLVSLNIRLTGGSRTGTPRLELCNDTAQVPTNAWYYYTGLTGTITFGIQGSPIGITLNGGAFQVGVGADGQNYLVLGGSGRIKLSDGREGGLSFQFSNIQSCLIQTNPLASNNTALLSLFAHAEYQRARIEWVNNTGYKNDFFVVQKLNTQGEFEDIHVTNSILPTRELQYFTFYDNNLTEGENIYRIKLDYNDGTVRYSEIKKLNFKDVNTALVFPNPASDFINIGLPQLKGKNANIYVYNSFGQQILFQTVENVGDVPVRMDISKFTTGNFLIRVTAKGQRDMTKTLIIAR